MRTFYPASERIESGANALRNRILESYYTLTPHADRRMAERGITLKDVIDCIKHGCIASARDKIDNYFCVDFYYGRPGEELVVPVRAPFGDYSAKPVILTSYRNNTYDYVPEGDLDDVVEHVVVEKAVIKAPDDMTDEELEEVLARRREEKANKVRRENAARTSVLLSRQAKARRERDLLETELAAIQSEIETLKNYPEHGA